MFGILIFQGVSGRGEGVEGQNVAQDDKKILSVQLHISGTIYHMILINDTYVERIISPGVFLHFFQILIFGINSGKKGKKWPEMTKNYVCANTPYLSKHT